MAEEKLQQDVKAEVYEALIQLDPYKATGIDGFVQTHLKNVHCSCLFISLSVTC